MTSAPFHVEIADDDGRPLACADVEVTGVAASACLHVEPGQLPPGTRARLVDAVLDSPEVGLCRQVRVALPLGDTEILERVRERCDAVTPRSAGSTCLLEADLPAWACGQSDRVVAVSGDAGWHGAQPTPGGGGASPAVSHTTRSSAPMPPHRCGCAFHGRVS